MEEQKKELVTLRNKNPQGFQSLNEVDIEQEIKNIEQNITFCKENV